MLDMDVMAPAAVLKGGYKVDVSRGERVGRGIVRMVLAAG